MKQILMNEISKVSDNEVALMLSSGIDSNCLMFALLEAGKSVHAYTFCLDDRVSTDALLARRNAETFGVKFTLISLPTNPEILMNDLICLARIGARSKTDFECGFPMVYVYPRVKERVMFSGIGADDHFCLTKKGMIYFKNDIDKFRNIQFSKPNNCQKQIHDWLCAAHDKVWVTPYLVQEMQDHFHGKSWDEVNLPRQKQPILDAFPEQFKKITVRKHQDFQKGDSGISDVFQSLVNTDYNKHGYKSAVGIYNTILREIL
jgi:asparagine synthetase B (glutamine-hydrolysing)